MTTEQVPLAEQPAPSLADQISMVRGIIEYFEGRDDARLPASALRAVLATLQQHERAMAALRKIADAREFVCDGVTAGCCYGYATKDIAEKTLLAALDDAASAAATPAGKGE